MAAIANALADDAMRNAFIDGPTERILRPLMAPEEFTAGPAPVGAPGPAPGDTRDRDASSAVGRSHHVPR
jgi:hypothetical protein